MIIKKTALLLLALFSTMLTASAARSAEAETVLSVFKSLQGHKVIICSMANVNWNITEAENVYSWTGKWPAMNTFDFIHAPYSKDVNPNGWIDYSDMTVVSNWWQQGGIVSCMWHWLQRNNSGNGLAFYSDETSFDPSDINRPASEGYAKMVSDMDQIAGYFQQMQALGIPVVWRPMHEAAGNTNNYSGGTAWFWWGSKGADVYKQLWRFMYNYFTETKGLDNLIWVWDCGNKDDDWYPGDEYVDVVGTDYYGSNVNAISALYTHHTAVYPSKLVALTECGNSGSNLLPSLQRLWDAGCQWLWAMPWYDYAYNDAGNTTHPNHDYHDWFSDAMLLDYAVDRTTMKSLLDAALTSVRTPALQTPSAEGPLFDLQGRRIATAPRPGVYIRSGRTIVIK